MLCRFLSRHGEIWSLQNEYCERSPDRIRYHLCSSRGGCSMDMMESCSAAGLSIAGAKEE